MSWTWIAVGAAYCGLSVGAGAFGAHGLPGRIEAAGLTLWETGARYLMYGGLGAILMGLAQGLADRRAFDWAAISLLLGAAIFGGTLAAMALGGPRWLGAVTPLGGLLMMGAFLLFAVEAWRL